MARNQTEITELDNGRGPLDALWDAHDALHRRSYSARMRGRLDKPRVLKRLIQRDGWICRYCGIDVGPCPDDLPPVIEHLTPLSRLGTNELDNLGIACAACNQAKGTMTEQEYLDHLEASR
jgi:5-methylcytosine-specific restriction endonuclease McrA